MSEVLGAGSPLDRVPKSAELTDFDRRVAGTLNNPAVHMMMLDSFKEYLTQYQALNGAPFHLFQMIGAGPYRNHTLVITAAGGSPTVGNGTAVTRYTQLGNLVHYWGTLTFGTTTSLGTGAVSLSLPISGASAATQVMMGIQFVDVSTGNQQVYVASIAAGANICNPFYLLAFSGNAAQLTSTAPWTWAAGDNIAWNFLYEAA